MATYFPQINSNLILTQLPYSSAASFQTMRSEQETGMVWAYPLVGAGLANYPSNPLNKFMVTFPTITTAEVNTLFTFFQSMLGRYGSFRFLDPGGNLLTYSQDFTNSAWSKTLSATTGAPDPFGHTLGCSLTAGRMQAVAGPSDGGMSGMILCASIWLRGNPSATTATLGFVDQTTSISYTVTVQVPGGSWVRANYRLVLPTNNQFVFYLNLAGPCYAFGAQVSPMKGEGAYVETPGNYGYHQYCRFDTDNFTVAALGPNQNGLELPIAEFNNL